MNNFRFKIDEKSLNVFGPLFDLINAKSLKAMSPEDARFAYMEQWIKFLSVLNKKHAFTYQQIDN